MLTAADWPPFHLCHRTGQALDASQGPLRECARHLDSLTHHARSSDPHELSIGQAEIVRKHVTGCERQPQSRPVRSFQYRSQIAVQKSTDEVHSIIETLKHVPAPRA